MDKKILIGSMLVLTLLLLMPSIPAIQQNIVKDDINEKILSELPEDLDFKDIKYIKSLEQIKHPLIYIIIVFWIAFRQSRGNFLFDLSCDVDIGGYYIHYPLMFLRSVYLILLTSHIIDFWNWFSDKYGWNWNIPY